MLERKKTRQITLGTVKIGGNAPVVVQSMTKTDTRDLRSTVRQIRKLERLGCEVVRVAVPDMEAAESIGEIKKRVSLPLIADIHFDWRLAIRAIERGADGLRINPGNIGARWKVKEVVSAAKQRGVPIRVGVNSGSLPRDIIKKYGHPTAEALVEAASRQLEMLQQMSFEDIKVSLKGSDVPLTVDAYRLFSEQFDYPLHIGITEAGPPPTGVVKSAVGLGILLSEGIGDTIRVSLTAPPYDEVRVAYEILSSLGIRQHGVNLISCPTCGRCTVNIQAVAKRLQRKLDSINKELTVAVMGCVVNGPGEAREADYGVAGSKGEAIVFKKGRVIKKVRQEDMLEELLQLIREAE
ncbi:MAG: flavodoxin-dependent (E)-4-hydroxy-3-methylbut-2-enyl-diphosphate synthase [Nitrospirae bacterium]|nr:MAG: flavodoxin-dependent (E)-4-hydroxy-3-methylbut-2-enyl-diphosphate synthase [Nitrospirota bacterium]